jgi:hypothetical protein
MKDLEMAVNYYRNALLRRKPDFVPKRIMVLTLCTSDKSSFDKPEDVRIVEQGEYECFSNQYGAVSVECGNGKQLGITPEDFEVIEWRAA